MSDKPLAKSERQIRKNFPEKRNRPVLRFEAQILFLNVFGRSLAKFEMPT